MRRKVFTTSILCAMLAVAAGLPALAHAQSQTPATPRTPAAQPGILPPHGHAYGRTYSQWSVAWTQYVLAQPISVNPLLDTTGANCAVGQSGPVFFLVGTFGSNQPVERNCTVPAGKALFFPLVNEYAFHVPCTDQTIGFCDTDTTDQKMWDDQLVLAFDFTATTNLHATIDGVQVGNLDDPATTPYRACAGPSNEGCSTPGFSVTLPANNVFTTLLPPVPVPAGTYSPTVADGFYLLLAPLTPGKHTITFGGTNTTGNNPTNTQDITYNLTVSAP